MSKEAQENDRRTADARWETIRIRSRWVRAVRWFLKIILLFRKRWRISTAERIPERIVHAKGSGAHGYFVCNEPDIAKYTTAKLFSAVGKKTPTFHALFDRRRREGLGGHRTRSARLRAEVLHRRRQLGHDRQQHAGFLYSRSA